jgi:UDP-N-acetylmuramyl pentapeptide synthase
MSTKEEQIETAFTYHAPIGDQVDRYDYIRQAAKKFALLIVANTPASREQSVALTELETAVMWANAAIARNE